MTNLYDETVLFLATKGKSIDDVVFVSGNGHEIPIDNFVAAAKDYNYDSIFTNEVPIDLLVVGKDWWIERSKYDGSECWEYKTMPLRPKHIKRISGFGSIGRYLYGREEERNDDIV